MDSNKIKELQAGVRKELYENIIPFWSNRTIDEKGGFIGRMTNDGTVDKKAPKGLVLNTRILWTFSAMYVFDKKAEYLALAKRAYDYIMEHFWDGQYGGAYWMLDSEGKPLEDKKQVYAEAFTIYALSEYYRASADKGALDKARTLFELLERYAHDAQYGGYCESLDRDWKKSKTQQLTSGDMATQKSMNTHLHVTEGFANLYDVWKDGLLGQRLEELLYIFTDCIIQRDRFYCQLFFDEQWRTRSDKISFGHDIEASWLLYKDAQILNKPNVVAMLREDGLRIARMIYEFGMDKNKESVLNEGDTRNVTNTERHWWIEAEGVVGFLNAYQLSGKEEFLDAACNTWKFIENYIVDRQNGEWFWKVFDNGKIDEASFKVSEWKCPYHNSRACIEIIKRTDAILRGDSAGGAAKSRT